MENINDLVSVFIVTRNRPALLLRAVKSVISQSYNEIELIIVDDNSDQSSEELVNVTISDSKRNISYKYLMNEKQMGACFSRNKAISNCNGKFTTGLDDDDYFLKNRIAEFIKHFDPKYSFLCSPVQTIVGSMTTTINTNSMLIGMNEILFRNYVGNQVFTLTERYKSLGGYDTNLPALQDHDMWTRLIQKYGAAIRIGPPTICIDKTHAKRISTGSQKINGYKLWYEKHKHLMTDKHREAFNVMVSLSAGNPTFLQMIKCKYWHNRLRIAKYLLLRLFPKRSRAMYN